MIATRILSVVALTVGGFGLTAPMTSAQEAAEAPVLFFEGDMVRGGGPGASGPACVLTNQFRPTESVVWRVRVLDQTGAALDDAALQSLAVELPDGQSFPMKFGPHPGRGPATDHFWSAAWQIPENHPTGSFTYKVTATDLQGEAVSWEPFRIGSSQLTVIP